MPDLGEAPGSSARMHLALWGLASVVAVVMAWTNYLGAGRDDAFLTLWAGEQLAAGAGIVNHDGEALEISSSLLHTWIVAAIAWTEVVPTYLGNKLAGLCALVLTLGLVVGARRSLAPEAQTRLAALVLVLVILATTPSLLYWTMGGLETPFVVLLWLAVAVSALRVWEEPAAGRLVAFVLAQVLLVGARPEGFVVLALPAGMIGLGMWLRRSVRRYAFCLVLPAGAFAALCLWRLLRFGGLWPNPVYAKTSLGLHRIEAGLHYAGGFCTSSLLVPVMGLVALAVLVRVVLRIARARGAGTLEPEAARDAAVLAPVAVVVVVTVGVGGDWMEFHRFLQPVLPPLLTMGGAEAARVATIGRRGS